MGRCLQVLFVFVNFLVFVLGAALTALSIWLLVDPVWRRKIFIGENCATFQK